MCPSYAKDVKMNKDALTVEEVAELLQIGRNAVYELARNGEIGSYKIGRKLRFTYADVQEYIISSHQPKRQGARSVRTPNLPSVDDQRFVICGQNMILDVLANYLSQEGVPAARVYAGSYDSLLLLYKGQTHVAATHLWDGGTGEYNLPYISKLLPGLSTVVVRLLSRMQGFIVARGNPKGICDWADLAKPGITIMNQEKGVGARVLLDEHLRLLKIRPSSIDGYDNEARSRITSATAIANGRADVIVGTEKIARQVDGVDFVPMQMEHIDLVMRSEVFESADAQKMMELLESDILREDFGGVNGYDISNMGRIVSLG